VYGDVGRGNVLGGGEGSLVCRKLKIAKHR